MKKFTVTVAVSAFNEGDNILPFVKSVLMQKGSNFILKKFLIISDGSTDNTIQILKNIKSRKIEIVEHKTRVGKSSRLNEIYSGLTSDVLIQTDADVNFSHKFVIYEMVMQLTGDKNIGMCGGRPTPRKGRTFVENAINCTFNIYDRLRPQVNNGHNILSADGRLLAYKKELVKKIKIPGDMIANDLFTYFRCISMGYKYSFVKSAVVWYRSPQNLKDHIKQNTRFIAARSRMLKYFPEGLVKKELNIPSSMFVASSLKEFIKHPIHCLYIKVVNIYISLRSIKDEKRLNSIWDIAMTTKHSIASS